MAALAGEIEFIEQPVDAGDLDGLAALAADASLPVMADEPVLGPEQADEVMRRGLRLVCVKLMKSGGLAEAGRVCDLAMRHGARVMIGCMDELPIGMAAAAHLALSHLAVAFAIWTATSACCNGWRREASKSGAAGSPSPRRRASACRSRSARSTGSGSSES